jgi:arsenate reductase
MDGVRRLTARRPALIPRPIITADDGTTVVDRTPESVRSVLTAD